VLPREILEVPIENSVA